MRERIGAPDPATGRAKRPNLQGYTVFVQSKGVGHRPLTRGTSILYEVHHVDLFVGIII